MSHKIYTEKWAKDVHFSIEYTSHIHHEESPFQTIDFYQSETLGTFFTLDGLMMVNQKDEFSYHDMISHVPMSVNPNIKRVLIIGGGDGGTAREISRYPHVNQIDMVEIDERVVRLSIEYLPQTASKLETDERIHLYFEDGVAFVNQKEDGYYDLVLVDSTDPIGPGEGLFSKQFYDDCFRILTDDGILINQHESPYFDRDKKEMIRAHKKIKELFPIAKVYQFHQPTYPSGHWLFGFASKKLDPIKDHKPDLWEELDLDTRYYNSDIHKAAFALPTYVRKALKNNE
ncbi:MAG: polyamine aminopropyltransferase [Candidatus Izemoplasmataceae bacterium]